jgi:hypothetical protein
MNRKVKLMKTDNNDKTMRKRGVKKREGWKFATFYAPEDLVEELKTLYRQLRLDYRDRWTSTGGY